MASATPNRARASSTTTGSGAYAFSGTPFSALLSTGDTCNYDVFDGTTWEVGVGTMQGNGTLARTTIIGTSAGDTTPISWSAGTRTVRVTVPGSLGGTPGSTLGQATTLNRANHTGTQLAATISDFSSAVTAVAGSGGGSLTSATKTANYTLVLSDAGTVIEMSLAGSNTLTVPPNASVAFPVNTVIEVCQIGAGSTTITAGAGVTLRTATSSTVLRAQWSSVTLRQRSTNEWVVSGDVV